MKKLFLILITTIFAISSSIKWQSDINKAIELAKKENRNILVFIHASHCPFCEKMEREVFEDKEGATYLSKKYIMVKMDINKANKIFPKTDITPTTYIFTPNKELLASQYGYQNEEFFYYTIGNADRKLKELKAKKWKRFF